MSRGNSWLNIAVEGRLDEVLLRRVLQTSSPRSRISGVYGMQGKDHLRENAPRYNAASQFGLWVILVDLNREALCPSMLVDAWVSARHPGFCLRVAVHAAESWLMADRTGFARFLGVPEAKVPHHPEEEPYPKQSVITLARKSSDPSLRSDLVPPEGSTAKVGPGYVGRLARFIQREWDPGRASKRSPSLRRALRALEALC